MTRCCANLAATPTKNRHAAFKLVALSLSVMVGLAACGPGVEGTGTDSVAQAFQAYGAAPATVCGAPLAGSLDCPSGPATTVGTAAVLYLETATSKRLSASYQGQGVTLENRCGGFTFNGEWGTTLAVGGRFYGIVSQAGVQGPQAASMAVAQDADGFQVVTVRDFAERVLVGPVTLSRVVLPLPAATCP
jgi:hypothetical protein